METSYIRIRLEHLPTKIAVYYNKITLKADQSTQSRRQYSIRKINIIRLTENRLRYIN